MINVVKIWHHYGVRPVLRDVSLRVETGEVVAIMGPNGSGKSTLLSAIAALVTPIEGYVEVDGLRRRRSIEEEVQIRRRLVYLPDSPWLPMGSTGREYLLAVGRVYGVEERRLMNHAQRLLQLFDLDRHGDSPLQDYSTGQRKKIGICSALITEVPTFVLDEPFSGGLDSSALLALREVLKRLAAERGVTVLMAVPVPELVEEVADRVAILKEGQIVAYDSPAGLRKLAGFEGPLPEVLERIVHPQGIDNIKRYLEGQ